MYHGNVPLATAQGLKFLRERIQASKIPSSKLDETINIATWNIKHFGGGNRQDASIHYIAEVINQFDLIAITELKNDLKDLKRVMSLLGGYWDVIFSDFIADHGGNRERMAYLFDTRAVVFTGLAAELDVARTKDDKGNYLSTFDWYRSPYMASFSAGSFDFVMITAHIRSQQVKDRVIPLQMLADWVHNRRNSGFGVDKDIILVGDFNITTKRSNTFKAITSRGLQLPKPLRSRKFRTNMGKKSYIYDQILHYPTHEHRFTNKAGALDFYLNDPGNIEKYYPGQGLSWSAFTNQFSDHLPLWAQINVDLEDDQLNQILNTHS